VADYQVEVTRPAYRDIDDLEQDRAWRILSSIQDLASQPRPRQSRKLVGSLDCFRLRVGRYRVLYRIDDQNRIVTVFAVGHRRDVYR
jgi:mRNA interferase RelE/StbE